MAFPGSPATPSFPGGRTWWTPTGGIHAGKAGYGTGVAGLKLHDETDSAWMMAFLVMPTTAQDACRRLGDRVGIDLRSPRRADFDKLIEHHRLFPGDPAIGEILAMGREDAHRRAN